MRVIVFFDLPVKKPEQRHSATKFRNFLIKEGFYMVQFSVYSRVCNGIDSAKKYIARVSANVPNDGSVRVLTVTEKQFQNMEILLGKRTIYDCDMTENKDIFI